MRSIEIHGDLTVILPFRPDDQSFLTNIVGVTANEVALELFADEFDTGFPIEA